MHASWGHLPPPPLSSSGANLTAVQLADMMGDPGLSRIMHLDYIPYGNARMQEDGTIQCQHGPRWAARMPRWPSEEAATCCSPPAIQPPPRNASAHRLPGPRRECDLNRLLACAVGLNPRQQFWFPYLLCVERQATAQPAHLAGAASIEEVRCLRPSEGGGCSSEGSAQGNMALTTRPVASKGRSGPRWGSPLAPTRASLASASDQC